MSVPTFDLFYSLVHYLGSSHSTMTRESIRRQGRVLQWSVELYKQPSLACWTSWPWRIVIKQILWLLQSVGVSQLCKNDVCDLQGNYPPKWKAVVVIESRSPEGDMDWRMVFWNSNGNPASSLMVPLPDCFGKLNFLNDFRIALPAKSRWPNWTCMHTQDCIFWRGHQRVAALVELPYTLQCVSSFLPIIGLANKESGPPASVRWIRESVATSHRPNTLPQHSVHAWI